MNRDRMRRAGRALFAASILGVAPPALGAATDQEQASAAAAGLSPQDRCAIAKLEATAREAACLTDAQIAGIRQGLTDQQVDRRKAACGQREQRSFKNAEALPGKCETLGDAAAVDYGLKVATGIPGACGESGPPCNARNPETLSTATLNNKTPFRIIGLLFSVRFAGFCGRDSVTFTYNRNDVIPSGQRGSADAELCLITRIRAHMYRPSGPIVCRDYESSTGSTYRTFQVVPVGNADDPDGCVVNRP